jgi:hypothetical protein
MKKELALQRKFLYVPMEARVNELQRKCEHHSSIMAQLEDELEEIRIYEKYSAYYGYVFFIFKDVKT